MNKINVVVIGSIHHNTLGVVRSLGEGGIHADNIRVLLVTQNTSKKNIITSSKYIKKEYVEYLDSCEEIIPQLNKIARDGKKRVIICCSDGTAETVISNAESLSEWYYCPSTVMNITELMEKDIQCEIAKECKLNIPVSDVYTTDSEIVWNIFPCITKPIKSAVGAGKSDILILKDKAELEKSINKIEAERIQIQQYVEKQMEYQLIGCSLESGNKVIIPGYTSIIRQPHNTNTGYLLYSPIAQLGNDMDTVEQFLHKIGYNGLFSVEFLRGKDGTDYFLEINMRNDGNAYCVESTGVNLPFIWCYYQVYGRVPDVPVTFKDSIYFIPDFNDLKVAFKKIGLFRWLKDFASAQSHSIYNKKDMKPFRYEISRHLKRIFRR